MSEPIPVAVAIGPRELVGLLLLGAGLYAFGRAMGQRESRLAFVAGCDTGWNDRDRAALREAMEGAGDGEEANEEA